MITILQENEYFVFGSNLLGSHGAGAALFAKENFGAIEGQAEGLQGRCYAIPTLTKDFQQREYSDLKTSIQKFMNFAIENPDKKFLMSAIGTGIAGFSESYMQGFFRYIDVPDNIIKPKGW